jgi:hypothetical protein
MARYFGVDVQSELERKRVGETHSSRGATPPGAMSRLDPGPRESAVPAQKVTTATSLGARSGTSR